MVCELESSAKNWGAGEDERAVWKRENGAGIGEWCGDDGAGVGTEE
mgnify:CR=1 FL=1